MAAPRSTVRRDLLHDIEARAQAKWEETKAFEEDAPAEGTWDGGKYLVTFPYPYMNGRLHLGHAFSLTKAEFSVAFHRMRGEKALFPFAFHCTGMPIQAAAHKLKNEFALYGSPLPNFPTSPPEVVEGGVDAAGGAITIGWRAPTCTGGLALVEYLVLVREGPAGGEWQERARLPASAAEEGQCVARVDGLVVGSQYAFKVRTLLEGGAAGADSRPLAKSPDGKKDLKLMAAGGKAEKESKGGGGGKPKGKPQKVVAKTGGLMHQWDILRAMGLSPAEIVPFVDPVYWLEYFPPLGKTDLIRFGVGVDWRRSFITTDYNPYYNSFVRWQFAKLRAGGFVAFGKRPSIFSEADAQPCMDHDRDKGEGVAPQEYTAIKMRLLEPLPPVLAKFAGSQVYALAGTLRPETMCGQTNAWILPEGEYGAFEAGEGVVYLCAARAARNMAFQDLFPEWGRPKQLATFFGRELLGAAVKAPLCPYERIHFLPLLTISMTKGTAIVTSVPSDSPDDYAAFMDMKNAKKREYYAGQAGAELRAEWIDPFEVVPVLQTPELGEVAAKFMCDKLGIASQKEVEKLKEAHDACYTAGFYKGVMTAGPFAGLPVHEAKLKTKAKMVADGEAITYLEPEGLVTPRSTPDVECVVALVDQWYLKYGEEEWAARVGEHLGGLECYNPAVHKAFRDALGWLGDWACSRSFGLGTRMPWDTQFLIESLSDSTIYMAYYTVAHLLQGSSMFGTDRATAPVAPEQCTEGFWDHVLLGKPYEPAAGEAPVPAAPLASMRREFEFWYPVDMRVSGKDLIPNHLTMSLYNHAAVWQDDPAKYPRSIFCNGHVQVDAEKMSKSKGNFIGLLQACEKWCADATRFACADAGDGILNANFDTTIADRSILSLTAELEWARAALAGSAKDASMRPAGAAATWLDAWFANEMNRLVLAVTEGFASMRFRDALKHAWYGMQEARDRYRSGCVESGLDAELTRRWVEWQALLMVPITPHWSEEVWSAMLGKEGCAVRAAWPTPTAPIDAGVSAAGAYLFKVSSVIATAMANHEKKAAKAKGKGGKPADGGAAAPKPNQARLYVARKFPRWKERVLELLRSHFDADSGAVSEAVRAAISGCDEIKACNKGKQPMQFAAMMMEEAKLGGLSALALSMPFDEALVVEQNLSYLRTTLASVGVVGIHVYTEAHDSVPDAEMLASAAPGAPSVQLFHAE